MRALVLEEIKGPKGLVVKEVPDPEPGRNEVRVRILASALNHRDLWITTGRYPGIQLPQILGSDGVGVVDRVGRGVDRRWLNRVVIIVPSLFWGKNPLVQGEDYQILGLPRPGTLAEYTVVPVENIVPKPRHLKVESASALPLCGLTAYRALFTRGKLQPGEKVLITGIGGGVATVALEFAVAYGAKVWATSSSQEKIERAKKMGARGGYLYTEPGYGERIRAELKGVDLIIDGAGGEGLGELITALAPGGRIVIYGATRGNPPGLDLRRVFFRQLSILGSTMGNPSEFQKMVRFVTRKKIEPIVDSVFPLEEGVKAFERMDAGVQFGKIVIKP
jgi:NADPH:quinone reductase-like Zn-dependent oxidoreductase